MIPSLLRQEMLGRIHYAHLGVEACLRRARETLYWPGMTGEIKDLVAGCPACNEFRPTQADEPLMTHEVPPRPSSKIGVDMCTVESEDFLIMVDYYSDYWEVDRLSTTTARQVITKMKNQFSRHGVPDKVISDNGPQFSSSEFAQFAENWDFEHVTSSPYHSRSNGKVESAVKIFKSLIKKARPDKTDIQLAVLEWRNTPTVGMQCSPVQRLMSRRTRTPLPTKSSMLRPQVVPPAEVTERLERKRDEMKRHFDVGTKSLPEVGIGETVRVQMQNGPKASTWQPGLCIGRQSSRSYIIESQGAQLRRNRQHIRPVREASYDTPRGASVSGSMFQETEPEDIPASGTKQSMHEGSEQCGTNPDTEPDLPPQSVEVLPVSSADQPAITDSPDTKHWTRTRTRLITKPARYRDS